MTVKVIGDDMSVIRRATCKTCAAILEYTNADTTVEYVKDYLGDSVLIRHLKCPRCLSLITVTLGKEK